MARPKTPKGPKGPELSEDPAEKLARARALRAEQEEKSRREREAQRLQDHVLEILRLHVLACKKVDDAVAIAKMALKALSDVQKSSLQLGLDAKIRLSDRLRIPVSMRDLMVAIHKLDSTNRTAKISNLAQNKISRQDLFDPESNFE